MTIHKLIYNCLFFPLGLDTIFGSYDYDHTHLTKNWKKSPQEKWASLDQVHLVFNWSSHWRSFQKLKTNPLQKSKFNYVWITLNGYSDGDLHACGQTSLRRNLSWKHYVSQKGKNTMKGIPQVSAHFFRWHFCMFEKSQMKHNSLDCHNLFGNIFH